MPRRKRLKISAKDLKVYETLVTELQKNPVFSDCDFGTLEIIALSKKLHPGLLWKTWIKLYGTWNAKSPLMVPIKY